jgi:hypothetical protein
MFVTVNVVTVILTNMPPYSTPTVENNCVWMTWCDCTQIAVADRAYGGIGYLNSMPVAETMLSSSRVHTGIHIH